jgi:hypothetical protein
MQTPYTGQTPYSLTANAPGGVPQYGIAFPNHTGFAPAVDTGYDAVNALNLNDKRRKNIMASANACLRDNEWYVKFFINDISITFGLAGSTGQSKYTRDFYPHNVILPSYTITAQTITQEDYGTLCEFVHQAQQKNVAAGILLQLEVGKGGLKTKGTKMKGVHKSINAKGFIPNMPRKYKKFEYSPVFQFRFTAAEITDGLGDGLLKNPPEVANWIQIIQGIEATGSPFVPIPNNPGTKTPIVTNPEISTERAGTGGPPFAETPLEKLTGDPEP